jgi:hypothetical protein
MCAVQKGNPEVKLYAQEPAFTPLDQAFLSLLDVSVCSDAIETNITSQSFVFSPFVDWYILLPVFLRDKDPVLYVGNEILDHYGAFAQSEEKREKLEECNELGGKWLRNRDIAKLSEFEMHPHALNGMVVYWVNGDEKDEVDSREDDQENASEDTRVKTEGADRGEEVEKDLLRSKDEKENRVE